MMSKITPEAEGIPPEAYAFAAELKERGASHAQIKEKLAKRIGEEAASVVLDEMGGQKLSSKLKKKGVLQEEVRQKFVKMGGSVAAAASKFKKRMERSDALVAKSFQAPGKDLTAEGNDGRKPMMAHADRTHSNIAGALLAKGMDKRAEELGPKGKVRSPWAVIGLSIVTVGIYFVIWFCKLWNEAKDYTQGRNGIRVMRGEAAYLLYVACPILITAVVFISNMLLFSGIPNNPLTPYLNLLILVFTAATLASFSLVILGCVNTPGLVRKMRRAIDTPKELLGHPGVIALLALISIGLFFLNGVTKPSSFLILYVGSLIWMGFTQSELNRFWQVEAVDGEKAPKPASIDALVILVVLFAVTIYCAPILLPGLADARTPARRSACVNNLKQQGLILSMFAHENARKKYPRIDGVKGNLIFEGDQLYPGYLDDFSILGCPGDFGGGLDVLEAAFRLKDNSQHPNSSVGSVHADCLTSESYIYLGWLVMNEEQGLAALNAYRDASADDLNEDLQVPEGMGNGGYRLEGRPDTSKIRRLGTNAVRWLITGPDQEDQWDSLTGTIPIVWEWPSNHHSKPGGHVLYLDGTVEFVPYPGKFPMTEKFIEALREFEPQFSPDVASIVDK